MQTYEEYLTHYYSDPINLLRSLVKAAIQERPLGLSTMELQAADYLTKNFWLCKVSADVHDKLMELRELKQKMFEENLKNL